MRTPKYPVVRILAMLAIMASAFGVFGMSASAAPEASGAGQAALYQGTGTVSASVYTCDGQTGVIWQGDATGCDPASAGLVFYLYGDGTDDSWALNVNGSGSISLAAGEYDVWENVYWTSAKLTVVAGQTTYVNVLLPGDALPPPPPPPVATGTVSVSVFVCDGQTGVIWGGTPGASCAPGKADLFFYLIGDGTDDYWALSVNGTNSRTVPAGTFEAYEGTYWTMGTVTVAAGQTTNVTVLLPGKPLPPPPPATGTVTMNKYICDGVTEVTWGGSPDANCDPAKATFYFYLIGDGTADYWTLTVDGSGSRTLAAGTYEVYEGGTWSMGKVTVTAGQTTTVNVLNPGKPLPPPPPATGTVTVNKYVCDGQVGVVWGGTPDANCKPAKATLYFYLIGDGTDDYWTLAVDGTGTRTLAAGTYEVWEGGYWTMGKVTIEAGKTTTVNLLNPGKPLPALGEVEISKYVCDDVTDVVWDGTPGASCDPAKATFYFYLVGDGTDQYWALTVDNTDAITLKVGTYEVWEGYGGDWSMHKITVTEGQSVHVDVLNPAD